jgi:hypothetical protein
MGNRVAYLATMVSGLLLEIGAGNVSPLGMYLRQSTCDLTQGQRQATTWIGHDPRR